MDNRTLQIKTIAGLTISSETKKSILDSALSSGVAFEYSCKNGQCGVCKTNLIDGEVQEIRAQLALTKEEKLRSKILTCCCEALSDILIDAEDLIPLKNIEMKTLPVRVSSIENLTKNIIKVVLRFPPSARFNFLEGQYLDLLWNGVRRSYSVASTSSEKEVTLLVKKVEGGLMSDYLFNTANENDLLRVEGPKGTFFLRDTSLPLLFMATGTGIAPIVSILNQLDNDKGFLQTNDIYVIWGNRYPDEFFMELKFKNINVNFIKTVSHSSHHWKGYVGYVQNIALSMFDDRISTFQVYACGSNHMINASKQLFLSSGLEDDQFYSDAFVQSY